MIFYLQPEDDTDEEEEGRDQRSQRDKITPEIQG